MSEPFATAPASCFLGGPRGTLWKNPVGLASLAVNIELHEVTLSLLTDILLAVPAQLVEVALVQTWSVPCLLLLLLLHGVSNSLWGC